MIMLNTRNPSLGAKKAGDISEFRINGEDLMESTVKCERRLRDGPLPQLLVTEAPRKQEACIRQDS
jgi:hypothetical protein